MRLALFALLVVQLIGCGRPVESVPEAPYQPRPVVEFSALTDEDQIRAVYIRHSRCDLLVRLSMAYPENEIDGHDTKSVVHLASIGNLKFARSRYENFDESLDMFQDGSVVLVPLSEREGRAAGLFLNLPSRKRYFFIPPALSPESLARIRLVRIKHADVRIVVADDASVRRVMPQFPEFQQ
jgi:hypothetical protein